MVELYHKFTGRHLQSLIIISSARVLGMLQDRNLTITSYLAHVFAVFEDFKLIAKIREEIKKVKPNLISLTPGITSF